MKMLLMIRWPVELVYRIGIISRRNYGLWFIFLRANNKSNASVEQSNYPAAVDGLLLNDWQWSVYLQCCSLILLIIICHGQGHGSRARGILRSLKINNTCSLYNLHYYAGICYVLMFLYFICSSVGVVNCLAKLHQRRLVSWWTLWILNHVLRS